LSRKFLERGFDLGRQCLPKDFSMLSLGRTAMAGGTPLEPPYQIVIEITDLKIARHSSPQFDIIDLNDVAHDRPLPIDTPSGRDRRSDVP
jgi:hypothetical protein